MPATSPAIPMAGTITETTMTKVFVSKGYMQGGRKGRVKHSCAHRDRSEYIHALVCISMYTYSTQQVQKHAYVRSHPYGHSFSYSHAQKTHPSQHTRTHMNARTLRFCLNVQLFTPVPISSTGVGYNCDHIVSVRWQTIQSKGNMGTCHWQVFSSVGQWHVTSVGSDLYSVWCWHVSW